MKLKFNSDAFYNGELVHKAGNTYEVSDELGYASRWIKRGLAEEVKVLEIKSEEPLLKSDIKEEILPKDKNKAKNKSSKKTEIDL